LRIKSLQLHGFKSFVDRTVFTFDDGVTAVVGPNGCGKSNVVDAIRWVMGEQSPRRLRGKGMDDVIFAGSEARPPIGMAEVVLTFDNSDGRAPAEFAAYNEIQITRRLYRSGESEYQMNKGTCRLREIHDFFRDSGFGVKGYTIVEQGRVAEIVSAKPEERRVLIEEAAGISKYKARRREAEGKIRSTEQNLNRVNDVLGEIRRQISSLERQARKAARYKRLQETQRILELSIASDERRELAAAAAEAGTRLIELRDQATSLEAQLAERELKIQERRLALTESEKGVSRAAEALYALRSEIKQLEGQLELSKRECEGIDLSNEGRHEEIGQLREQLNTAEAEAETTREELGRLESSLATEIEAIGSAEAEARAAGEQLRGHERERADANDAFVEVLTATARAEDRLAAAVDRRTLLDQRLRSVDQQLEVNQTAVAEVGRDQNQLQEGLRGLLRERDRLQELLLRAMQNHERQTEASRVAGEELVALREKLESRRARFASLQEVIESREDVGAAARHLLERPDEERRRLGLKGLVRELIQSDPEVEAAVEAVLSDRADALVAEGSAGAVEALGELRRSGAGRGVFIVEPAEQSQLGIVPLGIPLLERVRVPSGSEGVARALLGDIYLVDELAEALETYGSASRLPATFVTRAGDVLSPDGVIRGGGDSVASGMLGRVREVRELEAEVQALQAGSEAAQTARDQAEAARIAAGEELDNLRNRQHTAVLAVANHEKDLERTSERVKSLGETQENRSGERSELLAESEALVLEVASLEEEIERNRGDRGERQRELDAVGLRISAQGRELTRLENRATELKVAHNGRVEQQTRLQEGAERAANSARETAEWIERREREIDAATDRRGMLVEQSRLAEEGLAGHLAGEETARLESERLRENYDRESEELRSLEDAVRDVRSDLNARRDEAAAADMTAKESQLRLDHQDEAIREKWNIELATWTLPPLDGEPEEEAHPEPEIVDHSLPQTEPQPEASGVAEGGEEGEEEGEEDPLGTAHIARDARNNAVLARQPLAERKSALEKIRKSVQSLGDVNVGAIEEHEELAERFRFLSEQKEDLDETIRSLQEAIARINRTSRRRFRETFEQVSKRFSENFPRLFGGGKASLVLTETEDVLEAGIDIMAMPPGKRLQNVNLLSGGEKTMTALALLVAVFQVRPSPFFLLDEVDAALDDANVGRFNGLITEMAQHSQFLVITHNKRTIEVADVLYGVTMEQKGVSKLVAVQLS
jgi:chromosome segregation protein